MVNQTSLDTTVRIKIPTGENVQIKQQGGTPVQKELTRIQEQKVEDTQNNTPAFQPPSQNPAGLAAGVAPRVAGNAGGSSSTISVTPQVVNKPPGERMRELSAQLVSPGGGGQNVLHGGNTGGAGLTGLNQTLNQAGHANPTAVETRVGQNVNKKV